jgi:thymidylate synthase (FAD)
MVVTLLNNTPLAIADKAISKCWDKPKDGCDVARIERVANKHKHASTIEHLTYNFDIDGVSRALLQELARHRMANLSVKSSRYTLKELKDEASFCNNDGSNTAIERARAYLVPTGSVAVDYAGVRALEELRRCLQAGISNDLAKYCMPEAYRTSLVWTCNARALQNFLSLRTNKAALWEIRNLAFEIFKQIPDDHKFLFVDSLYLEDKLTEN